MVTWLDHDLVTLFDILAAAASAKPDPTEHYSRAVDHFITTLPEGHRTHALVIAKTQDHYQAISP